MGLFDSNGSRVISALVASAVVHAGIASAMSHLEPRKIGREQVPLEVAVLDAPKKVEPPPEKPPEPPKPKPIRLARIPRALPPPPVVQPKLPQPPSDAPPPPTVEAKDLTPNAPIETGITLESTSSQGGMAVGVGNTLYGTPSTTAKDPSKIKPYKADRYAAVGTVTEMPSIRERPNLRQYYPEEARRKDFEGDVVLRVLIDDDGTVVKADIVSDPGEGLGPAAVRALLGKRIFNPAKQNGLAVATTIPNFVLHFQLN
jgi:protein TonB